MATQRGHRHLKELVRQKRETLPEPCCRLLKCPVLANETTRVHCRFWWHRMALPVRAAITHDPDSILIMGMYMDPETARAAGIFLSEIRKNSGYLARQEIEKLLDKIRCDDKRLEPFGFKVYSQNDEDGIIEEIFNRIGIKQGQFCEIGVENGLECNSLYLIHKGWRGCWIEGDLNQHQAIQKKFSSILANGRLQLLRSFVSAENINTLLKKCEQIKGDVDFLSIDVDGNDIYLLEAM